jgi:hypothetical protein
MRTDSGEGLVSKDFDPDYEDDGGDFDEDDDLLAEDDEEFDDPATTIVMSETDFSDSSGDTSSEINVEELVARVESEHASDAQRKKEIRRRLEELAEQRGFEDTYAIDFDD